MTDLINMPQPAYPSTEAIDQLASSPTPGPAIAKALRELPTLEADLLTAAEEAMIAEMPSLVSQYNTRVVCRRDVLILLKTAAMNLTEPEGSEKIARRHQAIRTMIGATKHQDNGRHFRLAMSVMSHHLKKLVRGPGADAVAKEMRRVGTAVSAQPEPLPMIAHLSAAKPARFPKDEELDRVLAELPEMEYVVEAAKLASNYEGEILDLAISKSTTISKEMAEVCKRDMSILYRVAVSAMLRGEPAIAREAAQQTAVILEALKVDPYSNETILRNLPGAAISKMGSWAGGMLYGYLSAIHEGIMGQEPDWPGREDIEASLIANSDLAKAIIELIKAENDLVTHTVNRFCEEHPKFTRRHPEAREGALLEIATHTVRAAGLAVLSGDMGAFDSWLLKKRHWLLNHLNYPAQEVFDIISSLTTNLRNSQPGAGLVADYVYYAAEYLSEIIAPISGEVPSELQTVVKRDQKIANAAADEAIRSYPAASKVFGSSVTAMCRRDERMMLQFCVEACMTQDGAKFDRRVLRQRRTLDSLGFPSSFLGKMFPALKNAANTPALDPWFERGADLLQTEPPSRPNVTTIKMPALRQAVDYMLGNEESIVNQTVDKLLLEMPFIQKIFGNDAQSPCRRDEKFILRFVMSAISQHQTEDLEAYMMRHGTFVPRIGLPRASVRRAVEHLRDASLAGVPRDAKPLVKRYFDAASEAALLDGQGREALRLAVEHFEGRALKPQERAAVLKIDPALTPIMEAVDAIESVSKDSVRAVTDDIFSRYPYEQNHDFARAKCSRDISLVLTFGSHAALLGSVTYYEDKLLHWLRTIFQAFEFPSKGESVRETYELLEKEVTGRLSAEHSAIMGPYLAAAKNILPSTGRGALLAGAVDANSVY